MRSHLTGIEGIRRGVGAPTRRRECDGKQPQDSSLLVEQSNGNMCRHIVTRISVLLALAASRILTYLYILLVLRPGALVPSLLPSGQELEYPSYLL